MAMKAFGADIHTSEDGIVIDDEHTRFLVVAEGANPQGLTLTGSLSEAINVAISKCMKDWECLHNVIYKINPKNAGVRQKVETVQWTEEGEYIYSVNSDRCNTARDVFAAVVLNDAVLEEIDLQAEEELMRRVAIKYHIIVNYSIHREHPGQRTLRHKIVAFTAEDAYDKAKAIADANCPVESDFTVVRLVTMSSLAQTYEEKYRVYPHGAR